MALSSNVSVILHHSGHVSLIAKTHTIGLIVPRVALLYLPDSPRWLLMRGREEEARYLLARLADKPVNSEEIDVELINIKDALEAQGVGNFKFGELFTNGPSQNLRRTLLGIAAQFFQQISGINLIVRNLT